nr:unnamed protein product [Digitaria exilis]
MELKPGLSALVTGGGSGIGYAGLVTAFWPTKTFLSVLRLSASGDVVVATAAIRASGYGNTAIGGGRNPEVEAREEIIADKHEFVSSPFVCLLGKALCIALARKGVFVTVVDFSEENGTQVVSIVQKENKLVHEYARVPSAIFIKCDVTNGDALAGAFRKHVDTFGGLDICINCAGFVNKSLVYNDKSDGFSTWKRAVNVNLVAVIDGTRIATQVMRSQKKPGVIINIGSVAGLYPMSYEPVYSGTKGLFIILKADTILVLVELAGEQFEHETSGVVMLTRSLAPLKRHGIRVNVLCPEFVQTNMGEQVNRVLVDALGGFLKVEDVVKGAFELIEDESKAGACLWISKRKGMVNFSSGRYFSGNAKEAAAHLPFDAGFEAVGIVASVGDSVKHIEVGTPVALMAFGSYAEFMLAGQMMSGQVVLVTAAAGGTGQFAVQLAKLAGNKVVATCGGEAKSMLLASLGVDRVVNYRNENVKDVLKKEFPRGVDIIYESVGGETFDVCLNALAVYGRLIVIGMISQYQGEEGWKPQNYTGLCEKILGKSQTVAGFFLIQYAHLWQDHLEKLFNLYASGKLKVFLDPKKFLGVSSVADAVEYLHSGRSVGKVVVCMDPSYSQTLAKL